MSNGLSNGHYDAVQAAQSGIIIRPYSVTARLLLARHYRSVGFPDLAAGEAYIALLLIDEALGESGEFEEEAFDAAGEDYESCHDLDSDEDSVVEWLSGPSKDEVYLELAKSLILCGNLKQAHSYLESISSASASKKQNVQPCLLEKLRSTLKDQEHLPEPDEYPQWSRVRREVYPWNHHEPDRSSQEELQAVNELLEQTAPKLEARITELPDLIGDSNEMVKQIGLFAREDIPAGEEILNEKSILTATSRMLDLFCDACSAKLPDLNTSSSRSGGEGSVCCDECYETIFCSQICLDLAQATYHPALCGADISSLAKDPSAKEAADSLYALLLLRTFAMSVHQDMHPLNLVQVKYLWGDFNPPNSTPSLPFNLHFNVILPLQMLEKMDVNIFTDSARFNVWTFNTLYAKFRGTADARQGPDGKPEVGAVHPLWCLANHSCAPNVRWEWEGEMKFWVRLEEERVKWGPKKEDGKDGSSVSRVGLKKDEEVFGHYCDITLPVKERREWARGALGGDCVCERCVWEAAQIEGDDTAAVAETLAGVKIGDRR